MILIRGPQNYIFRNSLILNQDSLPGNFFHSYEHMSINLAFSQPTFFTYYRENADVISLYINDKIFCCPSIEPGFADRNFSFLHRAPMKMLRYTLAFMYLFNTCVTPLVLEPNCTVQTFSCHCGQSSGFGTTGLGQVSVASCVTNESHSKDVCSSDDVRVKCHEMQGLLQDLARFFAQLLLFFLFQSFPKLNESCRFNCRL